MAAQGGGHSQDSGARLGIFSRGIEDLVERNKKNKGREESSTRRKDAGAD